MDSCSVPSTTPGSAKRSGGRIVKRKPNEPTPVIGICGGVGPAAGVLLQQAILQNTDNHGTDAGHLNVAHFSCSSDTADRTTYLLAPPEKRKTMPNPAHGMQRTVRMIGAAMGERDVILSDSATEESSSSEDECDIPKQRAILGVPCNTFHAPAIWNEFVKIAEQYPNATILHMLEETIEHIRLMFPTAKNIGLVSTSGTRESRVYADLLEQKGYNLVQVPEEMQSEVHDSIYNKVWGLKSTLPEVSNQSSSNFKRFAQVLADKGADCIILGCTEIPFAYDGDSKVSIEKENAMGLRVSTSMPLVDPLIALARAMIREADILRLRPLKLGNGLVSNAEKKTQKSSQDMSRIISKIRSSLSISTAGSTASLSSTEDNVPLVKSNITAESRSARRSRRKSMSSKSQKPRGIRQSKDKESKRHYDHPLNPKFSGHSYAYDFEYEKFKKRESDKKLLAKKVKDPSFSERFPKIWKFYTEYVDVLKSSEY